MINILVSEMHGPESRVLLVYDAQYCSTQPALCLEAVVGVDEVKTHSSLSSSDVD